MIVQRLKRFVYRKGNKNKNKKWKNFHNKTLPLNLFLSSLNQFWKNICKISVLYGGKYKFKPPAALVITVLASRM